MPKIYKAPNGRLVVAVSVPREDFTCGYMTRFNGNGPGVYMLRGVEKKKPLDDRRNFAKTEGRLRGKYIGNVPRFGTPRLRRKIGEWMPA